MRRRVILFIILCIFIFFQFIILFGEGGDSKKSIIYFKRGESYYIKRDYQRAAAEWLKALQYNPNNKRLKKYFDMAERKYYKAKEVFHKGIENFKEGAYEDAKKNFKKAILLNPTDKKAEYYYKLCNIPEIKFKASGEFFSTNVDNAYFSFNVNMTNTTKDWIKDWAVYIENLKGGIIREFKGRGKPGSKIKWDLRDKDGNFISDSIRLRYYAEINSIYERKIYSKTNYITIDNVLPECEVTASTEFYPDAEKKNKAVFKVNVFDSGSGIKVWWLDIYNAETNMVLKRIKSEKKIIKWDGRLDDGSKIHGGRIVYYRAIAIDKALNKRFSRIKRLIAKIYLKREKRGIVINLPNIEFEFNSAKLTRNSYGILNKVGLILERYKDYRFVIAGHTDDIGSEEKNLELSRERAESVFKYLRNKFKINESKVEIKGYGESKPLVPNTNDINRRKNRRVEIIIKESRG